MTLNNKVVPVGIDHMAIYTPGQYLDAIDLAEARGIDPKKFVEGIGISQIAVPPLDEDVVVLAANAGAAALKESGISSQDIGLLVVGTESAVDKSKPTATHVHELLGIGSNCRVFDIVHACAGASYGILSALDWLRADSARKYALVIASDIARYGRNTLGEPTQGAGAAAMLLCRNPRLLELTELSTFSRNAYDFWKPLSEDYPVVDGMYSAQCYLEAALACFADQQLSANAAYLYHTPYPKLVQQTHSRVARLIEGEIDHKSHYETHVSLSHQSVSRIGNTYAASLWLAFYGMIDVAANRADQRPLKDVFDGCYLFSYGSGFGAALMRGEFPSDVDDAVRSVSFAAGLDQRRRISVGEYEELMDAFESGEIPEELPVTARGNFRLCGIKDQKRIYGPVETVGE
jgi:hydroxymethylglutaryl-CoA synthase